MSNYQEKLLTAIVNMTSQPSHDALGLSLIAALTHLAPVTRASLYHIINEDMQHLLEEIVSFDNLDSGKPEQPSHSLPRIIETTERIRQCITCKEKLFQDNDHYSWVIFPVFNTHLITGVVLLESKQALSPHHDLFSDFIKIYQNFLSVLTESEHDTLTGLRNRRTFDKQLDRLITLQGIAISKKINTRKIERRNLNRKAAAWLVTIDIDHFKKVNDNFGHIYGDEVLLLVSQLMKKTFRNTDLLFRFGGEEFVVILTEIDADNVHVVLERFRKVIAHYSFPRIGQVTLSIGYAPIKSGDFPIAILDKADKALYYAKSHGRNQVFGYEQLINQGKLTEKAIADETEIF